MKKIEFTKAKRSDIDEIVDMFRYTIEEMNENGIPQWDEIYPCRDDSVSYTHLDVCKRQTKILCYLPQW